MKTSSLLTGLFIVSMLSACQSGLGINPCIDSFSSSCSIAAAPQSTLAKSNSRLTTSSKLRQSEAEKALLELQRKTNPSLTLTPAAPTNPSKVSSPTSSSSSNNTPTQTAPPILSPPNTTPAPVKDKPLPIKEKAHLEYTLKLGPTWTQLTYQGESKQLVFEVKDADGKSLDLSQMKFQWESSQPHLIEVTPEGSIKALNTYGKATITVTDLETKKQASMLVEFNPSISRSAGGGGGSSFTPTPVVPLLKVKVKPQEVCNKQAAHDFESAFKTLALHYTDQQALNKKRQEIKSSALKADETISQLKKESEKLNSSLKEAEAAVQKAQEQLDALNKKNAENQEKKEEPQELVPQEEKQEEPAAEKKLQEEIQQVPVLEEKLKAEEEVDQKLEEQIKEAKLALEKVTLHLKKLQEESTSLKKKLEEATALAKKANEKLASGEKASKELNANIEKATAETKKAIEALTKCDPDAGKTAAKKYQELLEQQKNAQFPGK